MFSFSRLGLSSGCFLGFMVTTAYRRLGLVTILLAHQSVGSRVYVLFANWRRTLS